MSDLDLLNSGEPVVTYEMVRVKWHRVPVVGEIRYLMPLMPLFGDLVCIIWDGAQWEVIRRAAR